MGLTPSKLVSVGLHSPMAWFPPVSERACTYRNHCCDLLERDPSCVIHNLSRWDRNDTQEPELQKENWHSINTSCVLPVPDAASANLSRLLLWAELFCITLNEEDTRDSRYNLKHTPRTRSFKALSTSPDGLTTCLYNFLRDLYSTQPQNEFLQKDMPGPKISIGI